MSQRVAPLSDAIIVAVSKLIDDAQTGTYREPSHSEIQLQINRAGLSSADPNQQGQIVGKAKRIRAVLNWSIENDSLSGGKLIFGIIENIRGCGGFRKESPNYVGEDAICNAVAAFDTEDFILSMDGVLSPKTLEGLSGLELTEALESYARRAKKGINDAALLVGTSKDLLEATAAHILVTRFGQYSTQSNFPSLLGQSFVALNMAVPGDKKPDDPINRLDRSFFEAACAINTLRNKQGTGHGRPWLPDVSKSEAKTAVETMGIIAERMLTLLRETQ